MVATMTQRSAATGQETGPIAHESFPFADENTYFKDYLRFAIHRGLRAAESYENASCLVTGENVRSFFHDMAELKRYEIENLRQQHPEGSVILSGSADRPIGDSLVSYLLDLELKPVGCMIDACRFALKNELNDLHIYIRLAEREEDTATQKLFLFLIQQQKAHVLFVQNQISLLESEPVGNNMTSSL
jgi:rubrerythrin